MKKKNLNQKLTLNKKTIVNLGNDELNAVKGGGFTDIADTCVKFTRDHNLCGSILSFCCPPGI
ncbi:MAG: hypothetical protein GY950_23655 [bacterium]|nr:hypothetical protein [bacterium]